MNQKRENKVKFPIDETLEEINRDVAKRFAEIDEVREKLFKSGREVIRLSSSAIKAVHRGEFEKNDELLRKASRTVSEINLLISENCEFSGAGFVNDALKEYAEARIVYSIIRERILPKPDQVGVGYPAYLNGLGEAVGELRRHLMDELRKGDLSDTEKIMDTMDGILGMLVMVDFPDAITYGLRRTADVTRGIVEKTRSDLALALQQERLAKTLARFNKHSLKY